MRRKLSVAALTLLAFFLTACGGQAEELEGETSTESYPSKLVGKVKVDNDTDPEIRQFSFTDLDGVKQKCFLYGSVRGSVTCQPADAVSTR